MKPSERMFWFSIVVGIVGFAFLLGGAPSIFGLTLLGLGLVGVLLSAIVWFCE